MLFVEIYFLLEIIIFVISLMKQAVLHICVMLSCLTFIAVAEFKMI